MSPPFVKRYLIALDQYKWLGLASFVLAVGASGVVALQPNQPPTYSAEGKLEANRPTVSFSTTGTQIQQQGQILTPEILLAKNVIEPVAQQVSTTPKQLLQSVRLKIQLPSSKPGAEKNFQVTVGYTADEPRQATTVVALLMKGMVEQSRLVNTTRLRATIEALNQRLPQVTQELRLAERNLEQYDRVEGPALLAAQNGNLLGAITGSEQQQRQLQLVLQGVDAQIGSLQQKLGLTPSQAYAASALSADPIIASLRTQIYETESQMETLKRDLRPEHPTLIELNKKRQAYEQLLQQRANELIGGNNFAAPLIGGEQIRRDSSLDPARQQLANTLVSLETQRETLRQQVNSLVQLQQELRTAYATIPNKQLERTRLEQQVTLKRALYDRIQAALVDARAAEAETVTSLLIAQPPDVSTDVKPSKNIPVTLGIGVLVGLVAGGGLIFLLNALEGKFYTLEEVREALQQRDVPVLGALPLILMSSGLDQDDLPVIKQPDSPYLDFYERLRSNLRRIEGKSLKVLLLTSTIAQEGKTVSAYNLAIASARAGRRTLLIEADLRSPSQAQALDVALDPESLIEPLHYYGQLSDCVRLVPEIENLYIVPSPGPQRQAAAIIESSEMRRLLEDVRGRFDLVILDTPSLSICNDALLLEPFTDGIVLVTRPGYTENGLFAEYVEQLSELESRFIGALINGVDIPVQMPQTGEGVGTNPDEAVEPQEDLKKVAAV